MTARCVRVVQNVPFSPPRTYLEKDVSPSVLSSGGALSLELPFSNKSLNGALLALSQVLHQRTCGRLIATYGSLRAAPKNPMGKGEITALPLHPHRPKSLRALWKPRSERRYCSPFMDFPSTKRACHSPSRHPRPTLRRLDAVSVSPLNPDQKTILGCEYDGLYNSPYV